MVEVNKTNMPDELIFLNLDDIESVRTMVTKRLKALGFKGDILEAADIASAKNIMETQKIDFILSDWNLPDGTGFDFLQTIRADDRFKEIPFLMITTEDAVSNILDAINAGASNYLVKPWKAEEFDEKLSYAWAKHHPTEKKGKKKI